MTETFDSDDTAAQPISAEERDRLFAPLAGHPLALCVSGGADSMALMHLVSEWAGHDHLKVPPSASDNSRAGIVRPYRLPIPNWLDAAGTEYAHDAERHVPRVVVLTVDHGLRPEAKDEAAFVAREAAKLGLAHQTLTADEQPPTSGLQAWARALRHRLILELLDAENWWLFERGALDQQAVMRQIVMAHHRDDQAETVLMRLGRGSGLRGLGGMSDVQPVAIAPMPGRTYTITGLVRRPFLSLPKSRLVATLETRTATWVEDPSNRDDGFERVRVRKALSILRSVGVDSAGIALSAQRLRAAETSLQRFEAKWRHGLVNWHGGLFCDVLCQDIHERGQASLVRLLSMLLAAYGGASRAAELSQIDRLSEMLLGAEGPFRGCTLGGCRIELESDDADRRLIIYREGGGDGLETIALGPGHKVEWDGGRFVVEADKAAPAIAEVRALGAEGWARLKREIEGLDELKLKAAAISTMPAIWRGAEIVSVPYLDDLLSDGDARLKAAGNWQSWRPDELGLYKANFLRADGAAEVVKG